MKKNYVLLLFLFILGSGVFVSCYDDEPDVLADPDNAGINEMLNGITDPEVRKAIAWFEEHGQDASLARAGETHPLFSMMVPAWSYAFVRSSNDEYRTVEVPIWAYSRTLFTLPENAIAYDETGNSMYIQSLTRLVILTNKKKGTTQGFFMTLIPSKEYMDAKNFNVYRSTYLSREKDFDGYVYFHELDGSFANGWRYSNGKITHTVKMLENSGLARGGHSENVTYCYPVYRRVCTGYWQTTESGGREYVEVNCYEEYVRDECHTESVWVQDPDPQPGTGEGSGGDYKPDKNECPYGTPNCPGGSNCTCCSICKGPCKCEICHSDPCKCIRDIKLTIKSSTTGEQAVVRIGTTTERYYVPLYNVVLEAIDSTGKSIIENYEAIRFGVKYENGVAVVKGLQDEATYTIREFILAYCGESPSGDAWRIYGGHLLHAGPRDPKLGCNMYGCIGICNGRMGELNRKLLLYSNAKTEEALVQSEKFIVYVEAASKPSLVPINS